MNGGKEYKASRLGGLERVRGGEKVIIRVRERKKKGLKVMFHITSRAFELCFACRTLISN